MKETKNNSSPKRYKKETQSQIIRDPKLKSKFKIYALQSPVIFGMIFFNIWFDPYNSVTQISPPAHSSWLVCTYLTYMAGFILTKW